MTGNFFIVCSLLPLHVATADADPKGGRTSLADALNKQVAAGANGTYTGGKGVLVRSPDYMDGATELGVIPATFWVNDIVSPSQLYPTTGNIMCPTGDTDGYTDAKIDCDPVNGPWDFAIVAAVVGSQMPLLLLDYDHIQDDDWGWGVFYAADSNAVDGRCLWSEEHGGWDCPGGWQNDDGSFFRDDTKTGAGTRAWGNPYAGLDGGGAGCHFDDGAQQIDQTDAYDGDGTNLVQDPSCQCNYIFGMDSGSHWFNWVDHWMNYAVQKPGLEWRGWFGQGMAPTWAMDTTICWMNNPRAMIDLQNAIYWKASQWNNQLRPLTIWGDDDTQNRRYWGWNEVPVDREAMSNPKNWDAIIIKLPGNLCGDGGEADTAGCLMDDAQVQLEADLASFEQKGNLIPGWANYGKKPGSYVLFVREFKVDNKWQRFFFCHSWLAPSKNRRIEYLEPLESFPSGACYYDALDVFEV